MKKHILIYESIEIGPKYSLNLILISELFAWISIRVYVPILGRFLHLSE